MNARFWWRPSNLALSFLYIFSVATLSFSPFPRPVASLALAVHTCEYDPSLSTTLASTRLALLVANLSHMLNHASLYLYT